MCGRYALAQGTDVIVSSLDVDEDGELVIEASWNIAPTDPAPVILERLDEGSRTRRLELMRWGLVPSWAKDTKAAARLINARSETVVEKPSFRKAASARRALVPADGYYEWQNLGGTKTPYFLHDDGLLTFAGLYEFWRRPDRHDDDPDRWLTTFTVITRPATDALGHIHDRTPVIVPPTLRDDWLDPTLTGLGDVAALLASIPDPALEPRQVSSLVNSVRNNGPELVAGV